MEERIEKVGEVKFGYSKLDVYGDLNEPLFLATEVAVVTGYNENTIEQMLGSIDDDEKLTVTILRSGQRRRMWFVTETGLYSIIEQGKTPMAKIWRKIIIGQSIAHA